jgi:hypothetical protein
LAEQALLSEKVYEANQTAIQPAEFFVDRQEIEHQAWQLINERKNFSYAPVLGAERQDNARTALMEALTASGHLSRVEISGTLEAINHQVLSRLVNGWNDDLPFHEKQRRFAELTNELFIQRIHYQIASGILQEDTIVTEISDYPDVLDDDTAKSLGYGYRNHKGMVRSHYLEQRDGQYVRVFEQGSRRGVPGSTLNLLKAANVPISYEKPSDVACLEAPFVSTRRDLEDGVVDVMRLLDPHSGPNVIYGDIGEKATTHVAYKWLRQESQRREQEIECYIDELAELEEQLEQMKAAGQVDEAERLLVFKEEVDRILSAICTHRPTYAEDTFGPAVAPHFYEASDRVLHGDISGARNLLETTAHLKEAVTFCGMSITVAQAQQMGIKVNTFEQSVEKSRKNWKWEKGYCRNPKGTCVNKNSRVEIGPCSICRSCQAEFDKNDDQDVFELLAKDFKRIREEVRLKREAKKQQDEFTKRRLEKLEREKLQNSEAAAHPGI